MDSPQASTSGWQPPSNISSPPVSTSHAAMQGSPQQIHKLNLEPQIQNIKKIKEHLELSKLLHDAAKDFLATKYKKVGYNMREIQVFAKKYNLPNPWKLQTKVKILQRKNEYVSKKNNMEKAVAELSRLACYITVGKKYNIQDSLLRKEHKKSQECNNLYQYDTKIIPIEKKESGCFTYLEEFTILDRLCKWKKTPNGRCRCQACALDILLGWAYKFAIEKKIHIPKAWKEGQADVEWVIEYEMRHHETISEFDSPSRCQVTYEQLVERQSPCDAPSEASTSYAAIQESKQEVSDVPAKRKRKDSHQPTTSGRQSPSNISSPASTSHAAMQGSPQQIHEGVHIMEYIKEHINLSHRLTEAANKVLYEKKNIIDIALENDLDLWILQRKVEISKRTNKYLEHKFKLAVDDFSHDLNIQDSDNNIKLSYIARKNDIEEEYMKHLEKEVRRYLDSTERYIYEKIIISYEVFTSEEEEEILEQLYQRDAECHCQLCAMEYLIDLGYIFAKQKNIRVYPSVWNIYKKVDELWLLEFEMRNSEQMALFPPTSSCKWSPASTESSLLHEQREPTTSSSRHQRKRIKSSKDSKVLKPEEKLNKIKGWIKRHIEISDQLDKAAKQVLQRNKDIGSVAHEHKLDLWILNKKVHIIKFRKTQFDIKRNHEDAVNAVKLNILSVSDAAKEYKVDKDFIHDSLKKLKNSYSNEYVMMYEDLETDDKVLTLNDEFLLLKDLQRQVSDDPDCHCRSCALLKLPNLAYKFAKRKKQRYPFAWDTTKKADVIWTCEFVMRHSIEISNYFQEECIADRVS